MTSQATLDEQQEHLQSLAGPDEILVEGKDPVLTAGASSMDTATEPIDQEYKGHWSHGH